MGNTQQLYTALDAFFDGFKTPSGKKLVKPSVLYQCGDALMSEQYNKARRVFNRRFDFKPTLIIRCHTQEDYAELCSDQVSAVVSFISQTNQSLREGDTSLISKPLNLSVRSGGHDHEGECSGTGTIQIDFSLAKGLAITDDKKLIVSPGTRFKDLLPFMNEHDVGIPHGTCATVGVPGYTLGGGWGPWTRKQGMGCEYLCEADVVLGDGTVKTVSETGDDEARRLLWALRGGGGLSYGIVTRFVFKSFKLPEKTGKFTLNWNMDCRKADPVKTIAVLSAWEAAITGDVNPQLLGTNLKIIANPASNQKASEAIHQCSMYGYYAGSEAQATADLKQWFSEVPWDDPDSGIIWEDTLDEDGVLNFSNWDRVSTTSIQNKRQAPMVSYIPPEHDGPAPHKITSRMVTRDWDDQGRYALIDSLCSDLLFAEGEAAGVHSYVTLGAITGPFYDGRLPRPTGLDVAFPYCQSLFSIQYQVWWNQPDDKNHLDEQDIAKARNYANRGMDWIERSREFVYPEGQVKGAFISFKDQSVTTADYFQGNYHPLIEVKEDLSQDPFNLLRSRKTII